MANSPTRGVMEAFQSLQIAAPTATKSKPKIANLPLPRELRDEIYGYLVDAKRVQYTDPTKPATCPTYTFHLNITAVNKAIRQEVLEYLESKTGLVFVHLTGVGFYKSVLNYRVPHIFIPIEKLNRHCARILKFTPTMLKIDWKLSPIEFLVQSHQQLPKGCDEYECVVIMVQQDLPALFHVLWSQCQWIRPDTIYITSGEGSPVQIQDSRETRKRRGGKSPKIVLGCVGSQVGNRVSQQAQQRILQSLRSAVGCGYDIKIGGFDDTALVAETLNTIRPKVVWTAALQWDTIRMAIDAQRRGDQYALMGMTEVAAEHYDVPWSFINSNPTTWPNRATGSIIPKGGPSAKHWQILWFDLFMSSIWLKVRNGDRDAARDGIINMMKHVEQAGYPFHDTTRGKFFHLMVHSQFDTSDGFEKASLQSYHTFVDGLEACPQDEHTAHDLSIFKDVLSKLSKLDHAGVKAFVIDRAKLSCYSMPARSFDCFGSHIPALETRPARFENWQDKKHLAALSMEDKKKIQAKQTEFGFPVSEF